jgi:drug/metabolite transporter (DMT)-like permease
LLVVGDSLYFRGMDLAGVSWAMPVSNIHPLWAVLLAWYFVGEPLTWNLAAGALLVVAGIVLVSRPTRRSNPGDPATLLLASRTRRTGLLMALAASLLWAAGQVALKPATAGLDPVVASSARQGLAALILLGLTLLRGRGRDLRGLDRRSWAVIAAASLSGTVLGTWLFIFAIQRIGAGRNAVLGATAPMMAIPFSMIWLEERPTRWTLLGTMLTVAGVALVV